MRYWLVVASANHVEIGRKGGFMQVCHGKEAPLKRIKQGDGVIYYSPTLTFGKNDNLKAFTAVGFVCDHLTYSFDMGNGFIPFRRDVKWLNSQPVPIRPFLSQLDFTKGNNNWGYVLRFGLITMTEHDFLLLKIAMCNEQIG